MNVNYNDNDNECQIVLLLIMAPCVTLCCSILEPLYPNYPS